MKNRSAISLAFLLCIVLLAAPAAAATTAVHIVKYDTDGTTVLAETTVDYLWMEEYLPVYGDGVTHYYHQGPVFVDDADPDVEMALRWNPEEDVNVLYKDMGAVKGTNVRDLCDLVGGMDEGDEVKFRSSDGWNDYLAYKNIYEYSSREGPVVITWYQNGNYPDTGYSDGMRMVWFADNSTNPWGVHAFGNWDWHEAADEKYWYYYYQGSEMYPTTTGISGKYISEISIYSHDALSADFSADPVSGDAPMTVQFTDRSTAATAWAWDFDNDGTIDSTGQHPVWTYTARGTYTVSLTVTDGTGTDTETKTDYISVTGVPVADFTADVTKGALPLTVTFTDLSTSNPTEWAWDFENDGTVDSTDQNPSHVYDTAGTYTVSLTVANAEGGDSEVKADYIQVTVPGSETWYVDDDGGADFTTIQAAVDAAAAGDRIVVFDGSYTENVLVDKALAIRSENGSASVTVTAASPALPVFDVDANGAAIEGFTVRGPTNEHVAGIEIVGFDDCVITGNDCAGCYNGIHLGGDATNTTVTENYCHENTRRGISIRDTAYGNFVSRNTVENNVDAGICIKDMAHDNVLWLNAVIGDSLEIQTVNTAHSPEPITYLYNGVTFSGFLGNYYSGYAGTDADGDGVGETVFTSGSYTDSYPLIGLPAEYTETILFVWGPYLTGTTTTGTTVNVKTPGASTVTVEYADDASHTANGGYDHSVTGEAGAELHHIPLTGLAPDTRYHYRVIRESAATGDLHFRTLPESGTFSFIVYGDSQDQLPTFSQEERHKLVADRIAGEEDIAFVLHVGDLVNDATLTTDWDRYFSAGESMLANLTVFPALGNHEGNATLYYDIYGMPEWYSFDCVNAHFTVLDSNTWAWPAMDEQTTWLASDLATPADWNFVSFHHPPYSSSEKHYGGYLDVRDEWEGVLTANGVDMVMNGHVHAYERYEVDGITYMVIGTGGGPSYTLADEKIEGYQNSLEFTLAYAKVTVDPAEGTATVAIIPVAEISSDISEVTSLYPEGSVFETFVLELPAGPTTWYVDDDGGADFTTIQAAVDAAKAGDTVVVKDGHYVENVDISKRITLESEHGAASAIIETAVPLNVDSVIEVTADSVNITGFTLTMADIGGSGIYLIDADNCTISDTVSETNGWGIRLKNATHNVIRNTTNIDCYRGIALYEGSNGNLLDGNEVSWNADYGIWLEGSHANTIVRNNASGAEGGGAFNLRASNDNIITENVLDSYDPEGPYGLTLEWGSTNNRIYLNTFKNAVLHANGDATGNLWVSPEPVDYTYMSAAYSSLLGNYWDRYTGTDDNGDGIGDTPYIVSATLGTDSYPLMGEWQDGEIAYSAPAAPTADFTADVTSGDAPLTVQFTDASTGDGITGWAWDFENDGVIDSTEQSPAWTYDTAGTYTVSLTVTNAGGSDDEVKIDYITVTEPAPLPVLNVNTGVRYATISEAVTAATAGDEIVVSDGSYNENVVIGKSITIRSENGAATTMVTAASTTTPVFDVNAANFVTIDGFTVLGATGTNVAGIDFTDSSSGIITNNDVGSCTNGIYLGGWGTCTNNTVSDNAVHDTTGSGIKLMGFAKENRVFNNTLSANAVSDIYIKDGTKDNVLWLNNLLGGTLTIATANTENSPAPITYTYNGGTYTSYLGNYYGTYTGTDADGNGVGDTAFTAGSSWTDSYPLMATSGNYVETELPPAPTADFTADVTSGDAPLSVQFTDLSTGDAPLTYAWDFENDGVIDSTEQSPSHVYDAAGTYTVNLTVVNAGGSDSEVKVAYITVTVPPVPPTAAFTADVTEGDAPLSVQFTDQSTGDAPLTYAWDFENDGTVDSTDQNPSFTYDTPGTYVVSLTVTNIAGSDSEVKVDYITVTVPPVPPTAAFTADVTAGDAPLTVQFTDASTGDAPLTYAWDFENDGTVDSTDQNPSFTYDVPGIYTVSLTVTNAAGSASEVKVDYITVTVPAVPPTAAFTSDVMEGDAPLSVQFTDQSTGDAPLSWAWDFENDGSVDSTEQSPSFTYDTPGTYTVSLTVTNAAGSDDEVKADYITVTVPPVPPTAGFTADVTSGDAPLSVQFTDQSTGDAPLSWGWDFENDGTVDSTEQSPSFTYDTPGTYTVSLTVTNAAGSDSEVKADYITVTVPPVPPTAAFTADVTSGDAPLSVQFTDQSTGDAPLSWAWDFENDGTVDSTEQSPSFTYDVPGIYTVSLTVTNIAGKDAEVKADYITVNVPPIAPTAAFTADVTEGDAPLTVQFTDQSTGDAPLSWAWDFENDGTVDSTEQSPSFTYDVPGIYTVSLTVTNIAGGDSEVKVDYITVTVPPVPPTAAFTADVTAGDAPLTVQFTDQSTGDAPLSWAWDFENDGTVDATEQSPSHVYDTPGTYAVSLTVTNAAGSASEVKADYITVTVPPVPPTADFTADVTAGDAPLTVKFTDVSTGDAPLSWAWDFENDGTVDATEQSPSHVYDTPGTYTVSLTVTNAAGSASEVKADFITVETAPSELTTIEITPAAASLVTGETQQFSAAGYDQYGAEMTGLAFTWASSNETVGAITGDGFFTGLQAGTTTVTATNGTVSGSSAVNVAETAAGTPLEKAIELEAYVTGLDLSAGITNALLANLDGVVERLASEENAGQYTRNDLKNVENRLNAFINLVEALAGKKIPVENADEMIRMAEAIIDTLAASR